MYSHAYYCIAILIQSAYKSVNELIFKTKTLNLKRGGIDHCYKESETRSME